jgi:hypothetical protein
VFVARLEGRTATVLAVRRSPLWSLCQTVEACWQGCGCES